MHGFPPAIATHCPRPLRAGEEAGGRAGWGLQESLYVVETGEGGCTPLPVSPTPNGDTPHGPLHREGSERTVHGFPPAIPNPNSLRKEGVEGRTG